MKKIKYFKTWHYVFVLLMFGAVPGLLGCGGHDKALVIPLMSEEQTVLSSMEQTSDKEADIGVTTGEEAETQEEGQLQVIYVYVCGAVNAPGVVELPSGSRASDALREAGGFAPDARYDAVNLAEVVRDGDMLRFPTVDEDAEITAQTVASDGRVNINTADLSQLVTLNGIGEARAKDIIAYRENHGGFAKIEDIKMVPGIKDSVFEKIADKISVN